MTEWDSGYDSGVEAAGLEYDNAFFCLAEEFDRRGLEGSPLILEKLAEVRGRIQRLRTAKFSHRSNN